MHKPCNEQVSRPAARAPWLMSVVLLSAGAWAQESGSPSFSLSAAYTGDLRRNTMGGLDNGTAYSDVIDLGAVWVSDGLFSDASVTTNISVTHIGGRGITERYVGDLQGVNNLEAPNGWRLYESWVELSFGDSRQTLRAGVLDLNAEFDTPVTQGIFTASPFGTGTEFAQTGSRGPVCWPNTGLGLRAAGQLGHGVVWRFGAYDGAPGTDDNDFASMRVSGDEGALLIGELEYSSDRLHKVALGAWGYTADFDRIDAVMLASPSASAGNRGFYAHFDARLGSVGTADFDGALRGGTATSRFNAVDAYAGMAVTASHLFTARPGDTLGFGIAWARLGDEYRALRSFEGQPGTAAETTFELVYRAELTPWLALLPLVQFVRDPGADPVAGDSWVAGLRFEVSRDHTWQLQARRERQADDSYARTER